MEKANDVIMHQAEGAIQKIGAQDIITAEHIAESVLHQMAYWDISMPNGEKLLFVRLFLPLVQREEVFLGNILFNDFLSKSFARSVDNHNMGFIELVANDLENYYFLIRTAFNLEKLAEEFRSEVEFSLPNLFFDDTCEEMGVYGKIETMLDFDKANVEPFPVFIMPKDYSGRLEEAVRASLVHKIDHNLFDRNPTSITSNLAFFYSHDGAEMQSPYLFLGRMAQRYKIIEPNELFQALNLDRNTDLGDEASLKKAIENSLKQKDGGSFSGNNLREVLKLAMIRLGEKIEKDPDSWRLPYIAKKFLSIDEKQLTEALLDGVMLGYTTALPEKRRAESICRICGARPQEAEDKSILMGQNTHRFHNQSSKQRDEEGPKACLRCATCTYIMVKLIGSEAVGQPQVPKNYNLIFHYGKHDDKEIDRLKYQIDLVWNLIRKHNKAEQVRKDIASQFRDLKAKYEREINAQKKKTLESAISDKELEMQEAQSNVKVIEDEIVPWLKDSGDSPVPPENCSLDAFANIQLSDTKIERHVLGLGMGSYRMILFILPQIRAPRDAKEHDFTQRRFSNSKVTVTALLSFLCRLCGCDGPFYYQSLPTLTPDSFNSETFYIRNEIIDAQKAQNEYEILTQLAWKLIWQRGSDGFVRKVVLAEKLLGDPLGTFSAVMRDSPILGLTKGSYKRLGSGYRSDWKAQDLTKYSKFIRKLPRFGRYDNMSLDLNREDLDDFCPRLFHTLDGLGLLPLQLWAKPNEFEKYPRLLLGSIQRYNDVDAGFKEWMSRVLRDAPYRKEAHYPDLECLGQWMIQHKDIFTKKANMQHLRTSLYARIFQYLYPRRVLANAYCSKHQGRSDAIKREFVEKDLPMSIETEVRKLMDAYSEEWNIIVLDTKASLIDNAAYYGKVLQGKTHALPSEKVESNDEYLKDELGNN